MRVRRAARRHGHQRPVAAAVRSGIWGRQPCGGYRRRARLEVPVPQVGSRARTACSLFSHLACAARCCYCMSVRVASVSLSREKRATGCRGAALQRGTPSTVNNEWRLWHCRRWRNREEYRSARRRPMRFPYVAPPANPLRPFGGGNPPGTPFIIGEPRRQLWPAILEEVLACPRLAFSSPGSHVTTNTSNPEIRSWDNLFELHVCGRR